MQTVAPAKFADKLEERYRDIEGKKIVTGCGEKATTIGRKNPRPKGYSPQTEKKNLKPAKNKPN